MRIAIASGKGGTGKTTVAANLAALLHSKGLSVTALDCDVEEPNLHLLLHPDWESEQTVGVPVPVIDTKACLGPSCSKCTTLCRFAALAMMGDEVMIFMEMCHGCGLCTLACPPRAITESSRNIGVVRKGQCKGQAAGITVTGGALRIGEAMSPPLISAVLDNAPQADIVLVDCPPGTSCPMIRATQDADFSILVTEPTPFGLHDLGLAAEVLRQAELPFGAVINRQGMGDDAALDFLERENIPLLGTLPHSLQAAAIYSEGRLHVETLPDFAALYEAIWQAVLNQLGGLK